MDNIVKMLDENLECTDFKIEGETLFLYVESNRKAVICPYCGQAATKSHSKCQYKTFSERFDFIDIKSKKRVRLIQMIKEISLKCSSVSAANTLSKNVVQISHTTVLNLLKKQ